MEEQILKIIENNSQADLLPDNMKYKSAKEITSHIMEFIEWFDKTARYMDSTLTIEQFYKWWIQNIKNK